MPAWSCPAALGGLPVSESIVRAALRLHVMSSVAGAEGTLDELWVPRSNERADIAVIGRWMDGFEIKTERDTLRRLPRQIVAYGRLFDRCTAVLDERHRPQGRDDPAGVVGDHHRRRQRRRDVHHRAQGELQPGVDPEILVRLLWRNEAFDALVAIGRTPDVRTTRSRLWADLLRFASLTQLRAVVRDALLSRTADQAKIPTRRFGTKPAALPAAL